MDSRPQAPRRPPPAFQEYPADLLAMEMIREMSLEELGLLAAMRWACWSNNGDIPIEPERIARLIGKDTAEVQRAMTPAVMSFFEPTARTPSRLHCPELSHQRARIHEKSTERSKSGMKGARLRWERKKGNGSANGSANGSLSRAELSRGRAFDLHSLEDDIPF